MKVQRGGGSTAPPAHNFGTRKGWVVSATPQLVYPWEKDPVPIVHEVHRVLHENSVTQCLYKIRERRYFQTVWTSLHENSNDNGDTVVNFTTSKNLIVRSIIFWYKAFCKYTWTSPEGMTKSVIDCILIYRRWRSVILDVWYFRGAESRWSVSGSYRR